MQRRTSQLLKILFSFAVIALFFHGNATPVKADTVLACEQRSGYILSPGACGNPRIMTYLKYIGNGSDALNSSYTGVQCYLGAGALAGCSGVQAYVQQTIARGPGCCYQTEGMNTLGRIWALAGYEPDETYFNYEFSSGLSNPMQNLTDLIQDPYAPPPTIPPSEVVQPMTPTGIRAKIAQNAIKLNPKVSSVGGALTTFLNYGLVLAGLVLFVMLIWGGYEMLMGSQMSLSDTKSVAAGKQRITAAATGFVLLFVTYWIMQILQLVTGAKIF